MMRWAMVRAAAFVVVVGVIVLMGPGQVLAQMQELLGYVPGYGFVDVNDVRMMAAPISQTQGDVTVTVKQVLANQEGTYVVMKVEGLPPQDDLYYALQPFEGEEMDAWHARNEELWNGTGSRLVLEDGTVVDQQYFQAAPWEGYFTFSVLPKETMSFVLEIPRLPAVPEGPV